MEYQARTSNKPPHYAKIPLNKRLVLVEKVIGESLSIGKVAKKLNIKLSTAKLILKKYREDGTFFEKRSDRLERLAKLAEANEVPPQHPLPILFSPPDQIQAPLQPTMAYSLPIEYNYCNFSAAPMAEMGYGSGFGVYPWMGFNSLNMMEGGSMFFS